MVPNKNEWFHSNKYIEQWLNNIQQTFQSSIKVYVYSLNHNLSGSVKSVHFKRVPN